MCSVTISMNTLHEIKAWSQSELDAVQLAPGEHIGYIAPAWLTVRVDHGDGTYHNRLILQNVIRDSATTPESKNRRRKTARSTSDDKLGGDMENELSGIFRL